jgi:hypothetical protein
MSRNGGHASSAVLQENCNIVWLPRIVRQKGAAPLEQAEASSPSACDPRRGYFGARALVPMAACGQAAALPMIFASGGDGGPWAASGAFGIAAALALWASAQILGAPAGETGFGSPAAPRDLALHNAFMLALIAAASSAIGAIGATLLLPAGAVLALAIRQRSRERGTILLLIAAIAFAGICGAVGIHAWAIAGVALTAAVIVRTAPRPARRGQIWQIWAISALACGAIAFAGPGAAGLPAALGPAIFAPFAAGAIYGAGAGAATQLLSRRHSQAISAAVPFLAVALEIALGVGFDLRQLAAAALLAAAIAGPGHYGGARRKPAIASPNAWPAGWPQWP